ncbi:GNAT family N-acetyltransferase [Roseibacterium sp. SDUM158016]|uniref:GNAT family N-acetyltransferase n=1 Tax=Roseicyclus sediminis TaxID=2980997 RepID=UPI0021CFF345|nr:GNAT family N-acetyltransferase [Roseibacterium sp. SDUM158016]MCU4654259.1 GNAT family N-acetyltransferase [Roseibacterium sp. SDUM158016]
MPYRLDTAGPDETSAIADLHTESWRQTYRGMLPEALFGAPVEAAMAKKWSGPVAGREVLVLRDGATLAGFAAFFPEHPDGVFVDNLHVRPDLKGQGIGGALLRGVAERARGRPIWLEVLVANDATRAVYRAWGGREGPHFDTSVLGAPVLSLIVRWTGSEALLGRLRERAPS